ncbi:hypothetical protein IFM89_033839 [Coptis chinensis]|uniref:Quinolinate synthase, chloroplastic n=1 Tax=Coptis chinensis TaxID=261450 RepID=A0A835LTT8_9MAGN|nr:hypothetical protein IFM89_033839 [Coptis chinensis]
MESANLSSSSPALIKLPNLNINKKPSPFFTFKKAQQRISFFKPLKCLQNPNHLPLRSSPTQLPTTPLNTSELSVFKLQSIVAEFQSLSEPIDRVKRLLHYATLLASFDERKKVSSNRVMGCTAQVWIDVRLDEYGKMRFTADSDSEITRGFCSCLVWILDGALPEEVLSLRTEDFCDMNVGLLGSKASSRVNTWHNVLISMQKRTKVLVAERDGKPLGDPFPSLVVTADGIRAQGSYAEAQGEMELRKKKWFCVWLRSGILMYGYIEVSKLLAVVYLQAKFLFPDDLKVQELVNVLKEKKIGIAAHFYMDPEVQGILTAAQKQWPHIHISDSLVMADRAVKMAEAGCEFITVLGVDFMSENVRAILDQAGFEKVGVYRMSNERIGCSLADAADTPSYTSYLEAALNLPSLHVIYINTSLETKARAHELVPTITCTSSNVVQTILQAFTQIEDLNIWYGPDSYMGANIAELFQQMASMTNEEIAEIHPKHDRDTIRSLLSRLHYYQDGACMVHDLFGHEVVKKIQEVYSDAYLTAHLEVPGEMFSLAMEAKRRGMGVVGSTQNILDFIKQRVQEAMDKNHDENLQFVLGTESGLVTSIVAAVRGLLGSFKSSSGTAKISIEIVFPVSSDSMSRTSQETSKSPHLVEAQDFFGLSVIPGVATGEGCSIHGGCASCPYMKMNSLSSLLRVCHHLPDDNNVMSAYKAERFKLQTPLGKPVAEVGCEPILHMRHFQATGELPEKLVSQVLNTFGSER